MPLISDKLPNLYNGVSQQAVTMRLTSQAEVQENGFSSIVEGLNKRPPLVHDAVLDPAVTNDHCFPLEEGKEVSFVARIANGTLKVFDLQGNEKTVNTPDGVGYLTPQASMATYPYKTLSVGGSTFILDTSRTVLKDAAVTPARERLTMLFIKGVNYGVKYSVKRDGSEVATFSVPKADTAPTIGTEIVASDLCADLVAEADARFTYEVVDNIILITQVSGTDVLWEFGDSFSDTYSGVIGDRVENISRRTE